MLPIELAHDVVFSLLIVAAEEWHTGRMSVLPIHAEVEDQGAIA